MRRPHLTLVAVCSGWGTIPLIVRNVDLPAQAIVFSRVSVAAVGLGVAVRLTKGRPLLSHRPWLVVTAAAVLAVHWLALFAAYKRAPAGTVSLIVFLAPVGIAALAPATLGERHTRRTLAALALGFTGLALVVAPDLEGQPAGLLSAAAAGATFIVLVLVSKPLAEAYGGLRTAFLEMAGASILLLPVAAFTGWGEPQGEWAWLLVLGLVHTAVGTALYLGALGTVPATHVGILGYLEPAAIVLLSWAFLDETPAPATLAGGALIVLAGWLTVTDERDDRDEREETVDVPG